MTSLLLVATLLMAPAPDSTSVPFLVYDAYPARHEEIPTKFLSAERSRFEWNRILERGGRLPLGPKDWAWMIDTPYSHPLSTVDSVRPQGCERDSLAGTMYQIAQEELEPEDRGRWRGYLLVQRGGVEVVLEPGLALVVNPIGPSPDSCITFSLPTDEDEDQGKER